MVAAICHELAAGLEGRFETFPVHVGSSDMIQWSCFDAARCFGGAPRGARLWRACFRSPGQKDAAAWCGEGLAAQQCAEVWKAVEMDLKGALFGQLEAKFDRVLTCIGCSSPAQRAETGLAHRFGGGTLGPRACCVSSVAPARRRDGLWP